MTQPADWKPRETCRDPGVSCIVQAPAGSGKTELLTQRMLSLLAQVEQPEEVVAITFTRKAAAEMSHRLLGQLRAAREPAGQLEPHLRVSRSLAQAVLRHDQEHGWNLLEQPGRLRIRTIDSLCADIARQLPVLSGLGGGHRVVRDADAWYRLATARTMAALDNPGDELRSDIARMLDRYDNQYDRLVNLLTAMLGRREQWLGHILAVQAGDGFDRTRLEESLVFLIEAELGTARAMLPDQLLTSLPPLLRYALDHAPADEPALRDLLDGCGGADCTQLDLPVRANALPLWNTLIDRLVRADGRAWRAGANKSAGFPAPSEARGEEKLRRAEHKQRFADLLGKLGGNDRLREQFNIIRSLPQPVYGDEAWESLESLLRILLRAAQEWQLVMGETAMADFSEIAGRAIRALGAEDAPSILALRLDYRIRHLLVDEFQDTSLSQIRLLERLTAGWSAGDGRTLFLVGDPMQSIYRFRKAEVSLFLQAFEGLLFPNVDLQPLHLRVNFRSGQPIVDWVNRIFPIVMPDRADPMLGAVPYRSAVPRPAAGHSGRVGVHLLAERDDLQEARLVADVIRSLPPEDSCAILVRSRSHAAEILALLDRLKENEPRFRYQAIDFNPLGETPQTRDLVALTLALLQPADRLAWLSVLRAPFCGLGLDDLDVLACGRSDGILLDAIADHAERVFSPDGRRRLQRIAPVLLDAADRRGREPLRRLVETTWLRLGGPACVRNGSEIEDAATYFERLEALEEEEQPVDRETLEQQLRNLYAKPDARADGRLQVMTLYMAKGLQFDHVLLPGLNRQTRDDSGKLLHWFEWAETDRIVLAPMHSTAEKSERSGSLIRYISGVENRRQVVENGRLLYVAATRAIESLHLFAGLSRSSGGDIQVQPGTLMSVLWPAIEADHAPAAPALSENLATSAVDGPMPVPQLHRRLAADWQLPPAPAPVEATRNEAATVAESIEFRWAGEAARLTGELVHRLLHRLAEHGPASWMDGAARSALENWCHRELSAAGITETRAEEVLTRVRHAIETCLSSERGRWLLVDHEDARSEHPITAVIDGIPRRLVLDRTFVADGMRWIIDYKTSSHSGGDLEGFLNREAERYAGQLSRYRQALSITESRRIRTALYFPLLDRFLEI